MASARPRPGPVGDVDIHQRRLQAHLFGKQPGQGDRDRGGAGAAARAGDADAEPLGLDGLDLRLGLGRRLLHGLDQGLDAERLHQVVGDPQGDELAIEGDVVDGTDEHHVRARIADRRQVFDRHGRRDVAVEIDDQHVGRRNFGQRCGGVRHVAGDHRGGAEAGALGGVGHYRAGGIVGGESHEAGRRFARAHAPRGLGAHCPPPPVFCCDSMVPMSSGSSGLVSPLR
jgi:hypothetical protein